MKIIHRCAIVCAALVIAGCSELPTQYQLSALPLESNADAYKDAQLQVAQATGTNLAGHSDIQATVASPKPYDVIHALVQNSQTLCAQFVNSLYVETAATNVGLDALSTTTSSLATVFTPLSVTHSLSAASAVFSGVKTSIGSDYFNSLAVSHIAQAVQATYSADMKKYVSWLDSTDQSKLDVVAERSTIESFHNECSLAAAEGSVISSLQPSTGAASNANAQTTTNPNASGTPNGNPAPVAGASPPPPATAQTPAQTTPAAHPAPAVLGAPAGSH